MISVEEASARIYRRSATRAERVPLESALGRSAPRMVVATVTMPPWSNSSMDGYAVRSATSPVLRAESQCSPRSGDDRGGEASRPRAQARRGDAYHDRRAVPEGADSWCERKTPMGARSAWRFAMTRDVWKNIRASGEDYQRGDTLAKRGNPSSSRAAWSSGVQPDSPDLGFPAAPRRDQSAPGTSSSGSGNFAR